MTLFLARHSMTLQTQRRITLKVLEINRPADVEGISSV